MLQLRHWDQRKDCCSNSFTFHYKLSEHFQLTKSIFFVWEESKHCYCSWLKLIKTIFNGLNNLKSAESESWDQGLMKDCALLHIGSCNSTQKEYIRIKFYTCFIYLFMIFVDISLRFFRRKTCLQTSFCTLQMMFYHLLWHLINYVQLIFVWKFKSYN